MKKIFSLFAVALLSLTAAQAQVVLTREGKTVNDGDVLTFEAHAPSVPGLPYEAGGSDDPTFHITADGTLRTYITITDTYTGGYKNLSVCGIQNGCVSFSSKNLNLSRERKAGDSFSMQFEAKFLKGLYGSYKAQTEVYFKEKDADVEKKILTFTSVFTYSDKSGIEGVASSAKNAVRFDGSALRFSFPTAGERKVGVYAADGRLVRSASVGAEGSLTLGTLPQGVYLYRVEESGRAAASGKVAVK